MSQLRVALIILGAVFVAVLALWERRRSARRSRVVPMPETAPPAASASSTRLRRVEPSIEDFTATDDLPMSGELQVPTIHPMEPLVMDVAPEAAVDIPAAASRAAATAPAFRSANASAPASSHAASDVPEHAPSQASAPASASAFTPAASTAPVAAAPVGAIRWPPEKTERVLSLRVVSAGGEPLPGRPLRQALESSGMVHGPQRIFHLVDVDGAVRASAANLVRPGSLEPEHMDAQEFRGLSLFCILPGPLPAAKMLDGLVQLARDVAERAGAIVQDEQGAALNAERLTQLRRSVLAHAEAQGSGA
jgi:cell division protein ZipA